jgi:hypothetical protein
LCSHPSTHRIAVSIATHYLHLQLTDIFIVLHFFINAGSKRCDKKLQHYETAVNLSAEVQKAALTFFIHKANITHITAGYIWTDYRTNIQIAKELKITPILDKLLQYKRNWIQHLNRMPCNGLPRKMKHYSPTGRRNRGRCLKRLLDM